MFLAKRNAMVALIATLLFCSVSASASWRIRQKALRIQRLKQQQDFRAQADKLYVKAQNAEKSTQSYKVKAQLWNNAYKAYGKIRVKQAPCMRDHKATRLNYCSSKYYKYYDLARKTRATPAKRAPPKQRARAPVRSKPAPRARTIPPRTKPAGPITPVISAKDQMGLERARQESARLLENARRQKEKARLEKEKQKKLAEKRKVREQINDCKKIIQQMNCPTIWKGKPEWHQNYLINKCEREWKALQALKHVSQSWEQMTIGYRRRQTQSMPAPPVKRSTPAARSYSQTMDLVWKKQATPKPFDVKYHNGIMNNATRTHDEASVKADTWENEAFIRNQRASERFNGTYNKFCGRVDELQNGFFKSSGANQSDAENMLREIARDNDLSIFD